MRERDSNDQPGAPRHPSGAWPAWVGVLVAGLAMACDHAPTLTVRVQSDLAAGVELSHLTVAIHEGAAASCPPRGAVVGGGSEDVTSADAARLGAGTFTVAELGVRRGVHTIHVGANVSGRTVDRCVAVSVSTDRVVRVPIVASCQGVVCPAAGGSPEFTQCLNGRCVDPLCDPDDASTFERCCDRAVLGDACTVDGTLCDVDGDCTASATCRDAPRCDDGVCLDGADTCGPGAFCSSDRRACVPLGTPVADAGSLDAAALDAPALDAGPPPDVPPCSYDADCTACSGGYCVRGSCTASNPTTLSYGFEDGVPQGWSGVGFDCLVYGWWPDTSQAHGGSSSLRGATDSMCREGRIRFDLSLANATSLSFWLRAAFSSSAESFELTVDSVPLVHRDTMTDWVQYEVAIPPGRHTIEFVANDPFGSSGGVWIDDVVLGPVMDPSTGFEDVTLPLGYLSTASPSDRTTERWRTDAMMPHGGARAARSGFLGTGIFRTSMTRTINALTDGTVSFWIRTSSATRHRLWAHVDGTPEDSWSGETPWTAVSYPLSAGPHTIEWRYEKDGSASAGSDAVWVDDVVFAPAPGSGGPLCAP